MSEIFKELIGLIKGADTPTLRSTVKQRIRDIIANGGQSLQTIGESLEMELEVKHTRSGIVLVLNLDRELDQQFPESLKEYVTVPFKRVNEIFVPPDKVPVGAQEGAKQFEKMKVFPRSVLAQEALQELGIGPDEYVCVEGVNSPTMMRSLSYRYIAAPSINKTILLCDEENNRTFIIHTSDEPEKYIKLTKMELLDLENMGEVTNLCWSDPIEWKRKLKEHLTADVNLSRKNKASSETINTLAPAGWMTINLAANHLQGSDFVIGKIVDKYRDKPAWFRQYRVANGHFYEHIAPELIEIVKEELEKRKKPPKEWVSSGICESLGMKRVSFISLAEAQRAKHPEWFKDCLNSQGKVVEHYSPELIAILTEMIEAVDLPPKEWATNTKTARNLGIAKQTAAAIADQFRDEHPEWFREYKGTTAFLREYYAPALQAKIKEGYKTYDGRLTSPNQGTDSQVVKDVGEYVSAPPGWITRGAVVTSLRTSAQRVSDIAEGYRKNHPEWFKGFRCATKRVLEHYAPELVEIIIKQIQDGRMPKAAVGWRTVGALEKEYQVASEQFSRLAEGYRKNHPEWFKEFEYQRGKSTEYLAPELVEIITKALMKIKATPKAPAGWCSLNAASKEANTTRDSFERIVVTQGLVEPGDIEEYLDARNVPLPHYSPRVISLVKEHLEGLEDAPDGWKTVSAVGGRRKAFREKVVEIAENYRATHPEWFKNYKNSQDRLFEHFSPELISIIESKIGD